MITFTIAITSTGGHRRISFIPQSGDQRTELESNLGYVYMSLSVSLSLFLSVSLFLCLVIRVDC